MIFFDASCNKRVDAAGLTVHINNVDWHRIWVGHIAGTLDTLTIEVNICSLDTRHYTL